jgi:hypothetical protein
MIDSDGILLRGAKGFGHEGVTIGGSVLVAAFGTGRAFRGGWGARLRRLLLRENLFDEGDKGSLKFVGGVLGNRRGRGRHGGGGAMSTEG